MLTSQRNDTVHKLDKPEEASKAKLCIEIFSENSGGLASSRSFYKRVHQQYLHIQQEGANAFKITVPLIKENLPKAPFLRYSVEDLNEALAASMGGDGPVTFKETPQLAETGKVEIIISTEMGECIAELNHRGDLELKSIPKGLVLEIDTQGAVSWQGCFQCDLLKINARVIRSKGEITAKKIQLEAAFILHQGKISAEILDVKASLWISTEKTYCQAKALQVEVKRGQNRGRIESLEGPLNIVATHRFENENTGVIKSFKTLHLKTPQGINRGRIESHQKITLKNGECFHNLGMLKASKIKLAYINTFLNEGRVEIEGRLFIESVRFLDNALKSFLKAHSIFIDRKCFEIKNAGLIQAEDSFYATKVGFLTNVETGRLISKSTLAFSYVGLVSNSGRIEAKGALVLKCHSLTNEKGALLGKKDSTLTVSQNFENNGHIVIEKVAVKGSQVDKASELIKASQMSLYTSHFINNGELHCHRLNIQSKEIRNQPLGRIFAKEAELTGDSFFNMGVFQSYKLNIENLWLFALSGLLEAYSLNFQALKLFISRPSGNLQTHHLKMKTEGFEHKGTLECTGDFLLLGVIDFTHQGSLKVKGDWTLENVFNFRNQGMVEIGKKMTLKSCFCLINEIGAKIKGGIESHLEGSIEQSFINQGEIYFKTIQLKEGSRSGKQLRPLKSRCVNEQGGSLLAEVLKLDFKTLENQGTLGAGISSQSLLPEWGGEVYLQAQRLDNEGIIGGGVVSLKTIEEPTMVLCSITNEGTLLSTQTLKLEGKGISHTRGLMKVQDLAIEGDHLFVQAPTEGLGSITFQHKGGFWKLSEKIQSTGELHFIWSEGGTIEQSLATEGGLKYSILPGAQKPLVFTAPQVAGGNLIIETPTAVIIRPNAPAVSEQLRSNLECKGLLSIQGRLLEVSHATLRGGQGITLSSQTDIKLGSDSLNSIAKLPVALHSQGPIEMTAPKTIQWSQLEMVGGEGLTLKTQHLENISSDIGIKGDAFLEVESSKHGLLTQKETREHYSQHRLWFTTLNRKTYINFENKRSEPARVSIEGALHYTGQMEIFGSQVSCKTIKGAAPHLQHFIPSQYEAHFLCFKGPYRLARESTTYTSAIKAVLSVGSDCMLEGEKIALLGTLSAHSLQLSVLESGRIGQDPKAFNKAALSVKPFRSSEPLLDYYRSSALYPMSPGGETVFKPLFMQSAPEINRPRMTLQSDGSLSLETGGLRRLFTPEQEERLLAHLMMGALGRHFLSQELNDTRRILESLEQNAVQGATTEAFLEGPLKKLTSSSTFSDLSTALSTLKPVSLKAPCLINVAVPLLTEAGEERVLMPIVFLPSHFDNPRLRDGAGCLFALEDIRFRGTAESTLEITGNIETQSRVIYQNFLSVSRARNTWISEEEIVHTSTQRKWHGRKKTTTHRERVEVIKLQPGNQTIAKGERYENVKWVHRSATVDRLGEEGLKILEAGAFMDEAIVQNQIGPEKTQKQKGILGMGGTKLVTRAICQKALGSTVYSAGPIHIQAQLAHIDASLFKDLNHQTISVNFEVEELHFHELVRAIEAHDRAVAKALKEQERTAKRKRRQGTVLMLVSLPITAYVGGFTAGLFKGLGMSALASGMASGAVMGMTRAAIQRRNIFKGGLEGAFLEKGPLGGPEALKRVINTGSTLANHMIRGGVRAAIQGRNPLEGACTEGISNGIGEKLFPGQDLAALNAAAKEVVEGTVSVGLKGGSYSDLVQHLGSAALSATLGQEASRLGLEQGARLAASQPNAIAIDPSKNKAYPQESVQRKAKSENEDAHHKKQFSKILKKTSREASDWLSGRGIQKSPLEIETAIQKENALQGQYSEVKAKLTALGNVEDSSLSELNALSKGFQKVVMSVLEKMVSPAMAHEPSLSKPIEAIPQKTQPSFLHMFYRAVKGDRGPEVIEWQQGNRRKMPTTARYADAHRAAQEAFGATQKGRRILGGLQAVGGVGQTVGGVVALPVNPLWGGSFASMGVDNVVAGLKTAWKGEFQDTYLLKGLTTLGQQTELYGPTAAALMEIGLNMLPAPSSMKWLNTGQALAKAKALPAPKVVFSEVKLIEQAASSLTPLEKGNLDFFIQWQNSGQTWAKARALPVPKVVFPEVNSGAFFRKDSFNLTLLDSVKDGIIPTPAGVAQSSQSLKNVKLNANRSALGKAQEVKGGFIGPATQAAKAKHHAEISKKGAYSSEIRVQGKKDPQWELTDHGLYYPVPLLPREKGMIRGYGALRNKYLNWIKKLEISEIPVLSKELLKETRADRSVMRSMQEDDLAAIFKEGRGVEIFDKDTGELVKHWRKAEEAQNSVKNLILKIKDRLCEVEKIGQHGIKEVESLQKKLSHLSRVKDKHLKLMKESLCPNGPKKLKP